MKTFQIYRNLLISIALICILILVVSALASCTIPDTTSAPTTTEAQDPGFSIPESGSVRVETEREGSVIRIYVDEENRTVDLNELATAMKPFTVTDSKGALIPNNVITLDKSGDVFTVYYGDDKIPYRLTVLFNEYCNVTFEGIKKPFKVLKGNKLSVPEEKPNKEGYEFQSWDHDFSYPITEDIRINAVWKACTYTVTFDANGGTLESVSMTVTYGENVLLPIPTMTGYVFTGWHDGTQIVNSGIWTIDKDITLKAMWDHHDYKITYDANGGTVDKTLQGVSYGDPFVTPIPKRAGYTFLGWFCDGVEVDNTSYPYREDKTFIAQWKENVYNVTFESNGGSKIEGGEYLYSEMEELIPEREGYTFGGWFFDTDLTMTDTDISTDNHVIAYAWWIEEDKPSDYLYEITESGVVILGYQSDSDTCILPSYIGGKAVSTIGARAFYESTIVSIYFPSSVTKIGDYAFFGCKSLVKINANETESKKQMICLDGVSSIGAYAFMACNFTEIALPKSVTALPDGLFYDCVNLVSVRFESITKVGNAVFQGCESLKTISFDDSVTSFGNDVFNGCISLEAVVLPQNLTSLGDGTFSGCSSLVSLTLPENLASIGANAFLESGVTKLENFLTSTKITSIGAYAFAGCVNLTTVGVPVSVKEIGAYAFLNCQKLEKLTLPAGITKIESGTFKNCSYLSEIQITTPIVKIGSEAFYGCRRLAKIALTESLLSIGDGAFENCMALSDVTLGSNLNSLGKYAFKGCTKLSEITVSSKITVIPEGVFDGCLALAKVNWHNGITEISARAFADCQALSLDLFPSSCGVIGEEAFVGCRVIQSLSINQVLTSIGSRAFADCISLSKIVFSGTSERWKGAVSENAFEGCIDLKTIETVTWTYDDLRPSLMLNPNTNAFWAVDSTRSFNNNRHSAVLFFKEGNVFYKNLVSVSDDDVAINDDYVWLLKISGATDMISSFSTTVTVSLFEVLDMNGFGYILLDLGEGIAALQGIQYLDLNLEIVSKSDESKLLYSATLGQVVFTESSTELSPDPDRTDSNKVTVSKVTEGAETLFDNDYTTEYFDDSKKSIVVMGREAFALSSYSFITTDVQSAYPTTVPKSWTVYGGVELKDGTIEWVEVSRVEDGWMMAKDLTEFHYKLTVDRTYHQYKFVFDETGIIALAEIVLYEKK